MLSHHQVHTQRRQPHGHILQPPHGYGPPLLQAPHETRNVNGTGDTFGSAIATYIARKYSLDAAVERAEIFINESIAYGAEYRFGPGYGPVHPFYRMIDFFEREDRNYSLK